MTGFGHFEKDFEVLRIVGNVKTVNHRYLDLQIKLPVYLSSMEEKIRKLVKEYISRGHTEVYINVLRKEGFAYSIESDIGFSKSIKEELLKLNEALGLNSDIQLEDILKYDGVINFKFDTSKEEEIQNMVIESLKEGLTKVVSMRKIEGENLKADIFSNISKISENLEKIENKSHKILEVYENGLKEKLAPFIEKTPDIREILNAEIVLFADKLDINEEIIRIKSHLSHFEEIFSKGGVIGKKLDFLTQELNREINAIGSKSCDKFISKYMIEIKCCVEKIREQVQNLE